MLELRIFSTENPPQAADFKKFGESVIKYLKPAD